MQRDRHRSTLTRLVVALIAAMMVLSIVPLPVAAADPEGADGPTTASSISVGQTVTGTLESGDEDWYAFTAQQGRVVEITATRASSEASGYTIAARRASGNSWTSIGNGDTSDFVRPGTTEVVAFAVPATDTYYVDVDGDAGSYEFTVRSRQSDSFEPNDGPTDATSYTVGNSQTGELHEGDEDWFSVTAQQGSLVTVTATRDSSATSGYTISARRAASGSWTSIGNGDTSDFVRPGTTETLEFVAPATDTYFLDVDGDSGTYEFTATSRQSDPFEPNDGPTDATPYTVGDSQTGELTEGDEDWFSFTATAGSVYEVTATRDSSAISGYTISARRSDDRGSWTSIGNGDTSDFVRPGTTETLEFVPPVTGTYLVDADGDSGTYEFTVRARQSDSYEPNDEPNRATGLIDNPRGPVTGELHEGDEDWFSVTAQQGQIVNATATRESAETSGYSISFRRADDRGSWTSIGNGDTSDFVRPGDTEEIGFEAPAAGTYFVDVDGDDGNFSFDLTVGDETIGLPNDRFERNENRGGAAAIAPGTYDDLAMVDDDEDWFSFAADRGDRIVAVARFAHADNDLTLELRSPAGSVVATGDSTTDDETVDFVATSTGTHYLRVTGQADAVAVYSLQLALVGGVNLAVGPGTASLAPGDSATYDVVLSGVGAGIGPYSFTLESSNTAALTISGATVPRVTGSVSVASDGSSVDVSTSTNQDLSGSVVVARVTVAADSTTTGSATLRFAGSPTFATTLGSGVDYPLAQVQVSVVTVSSGPGPIDDRLGTPGDLDGDGLYEDINGDGRFNVIDVSIFLGEFDRPGVQSQSQFFDFSGDGRINIIDVSDLLART